MFLSPEKTSVWCGQTINPFKIFISLLMVVTGSINTIAVKSADNERAENRDGEVVKFNHPFFQANVMMLGECLCMVVYLIYWLAGGLEKKPIVKDTEEIGEEAEESVSEAAGLGNPSPFLFLPPALCDVTATSMMYVGLTMTSAAQFQMLRGSIMIFVGLLSVVFLKKRLEWFRWTGMAVVVCGIAMVGGADFIKTGDEEEGGAVNKAVIGDIIIVCAQLVAACQFVYEEKYITKYDIHPLKVVGSEGIFGFTALALAQVALYFIGIEGFDLGDNPLIPGTGKHRLEDALDAFTQMSNSGTLCGLLSLIVFSIAFFNFAGVSITKHMSATTRKVLDTLRTLVIWLITILFHYAISEEDWKLPRWRDQFVLQVFGFLLLVTGIFLYSDVLIMPTIRKRQQRKKEQGL